LFVHSLTVVLITAIATLISPSASALESDDFNRHNLDPARWTLVNPLGDGSAAMVGAGTGDARVVLSVPEGPSHDPWGASNKAFRIVQSTADEDFEVEVKFESEPSARYQLQGILVEQDAQNWMRFDTYHDGTSLRIFAGVTVGGSSSQKVNGVIASGAAGYLKVTRQGDQWTLWQSPDGAAWVSSVSFGHAIAVSAVGVFVANHGSSGASPAYTAVVDYCFNTASPLPEDSVVTPDTFAPLIHRIDEAVGANELHVSWATDERSLGTVEYGLTTAYELGDESDAGGLYDHTVVLTGLLLGNTYHYRILSEDSLGQTAATGDFEFIFDPEGPAIDIWYGAQQPFGNLGQPQPWANILGNVSDSDGVSALEYTLNGASAVALSVGPDGRRLVSSGDFNVDLATANLNAGANLVAIKATDGLGNVNTDTVTVNYQPAPIWPLPYTIEWDSLSGDADIQNVAQVVDGKWTLDGSQVRTVEPGYDRLIAIGDMAWDDYEVLVPITINTQPSSFGAGILFRWNGHTDSPAQCGQPKCGWLPLGAILWARSGRIEVYGNGGSIIDTQSRTLTSGVTYWFRGRVETNAIGGLYKLKVWEDGQPEPGDWDITGQENLTDPQNGSMMLITHQADVSFGPVTVTNLPSPPNFPPMANDDTVFMTPLDSIAIDVLANDTDSDGTLDISTVTIVSGPSHGTATLDTTTGLVAYVHTDSAATGDSFTYTVRDNDGAVSNEATVTIVVTSEPVDNIVSDDFNRCDLDTSLWGFVNPLGDGWYDVVGGGSGDAHLSLSLPVGTPHDAWGGGGVNEAVRVMQPVLDTDFEVEVKFNAEPTDGYNDQGLVIEEDASNWLRFDVYHSGSALKIFIGSTVGGGNTTHLNANIAAGTASFLRIGRVGDVWNFWHSGDGSSWTATGSIARALNVNSVGVYAGNPIGALAFTAEADYFFNVNEPIIPEDGILNTVSISVVGNGNVVLTPSETVYECGDVVELAAVSPEGWMFESWSGDLTGSSNPESLTIDGPKRLTATFTQTPTAIDDEEIPLGYELLGARPNPFNPSTNIMFHLPQRTRVRIDIFDVRGRLVRRLLDENRPSGRHGVSWDGSNESGVPVASGVYIAQLIAGPYQNSIRMVLLK
jgi:regulation of enolase protein 1 (concanavalin A-like superfamily)